MAKNSCVHKFHILQNLASIVDVQMEKRCVSNLLKFLIIMPIVALDLLLGHESSINPCVQW